MKIMKTFLFEIDFYEQIRHKLSLIYKKNSKVCTQLRIFQKEIKSTPNQEQMHTVYSRKQGIRHGGGGAYLRCPVFTTVHFSLHDEGSSEYICTSV